ncbi:putative xanthine dehydrogenase subunit A [Planctomycetes bacterium Pla163]|uniref:Putative xanthine dehydrogenase subunit A n=1 Tax=Rohdeia mirabilis TaxID=2528008 RepID=A0A518D4A8_9BACT|nr:putative xanthine dehydrogenase subunit A [Planctomycetes bacterium Pla163]
MSHQLFAEVARLVDAGEDCALCTIVETRGSTPGKSMMKMLVRRDGTFTGTVGGGCLEAEVLEAALEALADERSRLLEFALNERDYPDSGLICGGKVRIYVEPITEARLFLIGGGHISGALARIAAPAGFRVAILEDRPEFANTEHHPDAAEFRVGPFAELADGLAREANAYVCIVTRGHHGDGEALFALWKSGVRPKYLGMIGSVAKREQIFADLRARGVDDGFLGRVQCPMGIHIGARSHPEIAVSVAAELIRVRRLDGASASADS